MGQPIRKQIQEIHKDLIKEEPIYTLLIDGGSLLFHAMRDETMSCVNGEHVGGIFQFLLQLRILMSKKSYDYVYVFFDNEYSGWLRWNIYPPYKKNRDKNYQDYGISDYMKEYNQNLRNMQNYIFNKNKKKKEVDETVGKSKSQIWEEFVDANFDRERDILCAMFNELFIRWHIDDITEGDDLISYYCQNKKDNEKIVIVTGDMDISQLLADDICIFNLNEKKYMTNKSFKDYFGYPSENVLIKKIFTGDVSDNIGNIKGLSEEGFFNLMPEARDHIITINDVKERVKVLMEDRTKNKKKPLKLHENIINGVSNKEYNGDFYEINEKIINLKKPLLSEEAKEELDSMMYAPQSIEERSFGNLYKLINEIGIPDLMGETKFASFFSPFKTLVEKEKKYYNDFLTNS